ncbi:kinase-like domain-containing protein [Mrakia frigida]|uniref:serine/threonine-protein kinase n=1 Tax=Mrakia frigida TaxID=29902 RepID=UPI003FCC0AED
MNSAQPGGRNGPPPPSPSRFFSGGATFRKGAAGADFDSKGGGGTYRSSTLLHKGFYDLLAVLKPDSTSSQLAGPRYEQHPNFGNGPYNPTAAARPLPSSQSMPVHANNAYYSSPPSSPIPYRSDAPGAFKTIRTGALGAGQIDYGANRLKKVAGGARINKDSISAPSNFQHVLHASDADQAEELLMRWSAEGVGKVPNAEWAITIKGAIQARAKHRQAIAIAQVQAAMHRDSLAAYNQPLHITNGVPSSAYASTIAPTNTVTSSNAPPSSFFSNVGTIGHDSNNNTLRSNQQPPSPLRESAQPPSFSRSQTANTVVVRPLPMVPGLPSTGEGIVQLGKAPDTSMQQQIDQKIQQQQQQAPMLPPRPVVPTMVTLEKAAAVAIYFETLYHGLLKSSTSHQNPHLGREKRRLALERELDSSSIGEGEKRAARERLRVEETVWLRERRKKVGVKEFVRLKVIGHGAFGVVSLVKEKETGSLYAMKQLRKNDMILKGQEGHVRSERDLLAAAASGGNSEANWIVKLHYSFQDADNLYLVLDYCGGGDLLNLLVEKDIFPEDFTKFYIAEMVLALESCHKLGYIHRDIKPDNFLLGPTGHLCVSDFGLATDLHWAHDTAYYEQQRRDLLKRHGIDLEEPGAPRPGAKKLDRKTAEEIMGGEEGLLTWRDKNRKKLAYSVAGTNSYMSPEVIRGLGYGFSCDWWSLGVIMYECLYGYPPFVSQTRQQTRQKILNWSSSLRFPPRPRVSREAIDLIQSLLCEPADRIGAIHQPPSRPNSHILQERRSGFLQQQKEGLLANDGADQIKKHPWFKDIDWENIHKMEAPYQPEMRHPEDTRHFDDDIPDEPLAPAGGANPNATKDPVLRHRDHGRIAMDVRKATAFQGFTYKSPRVVSHPRADTVLEPLPTSPVSPTYDQQAQLDEDDRGRTLRNGTIGRGRALSL